MPDAVDVVDPADDVDGRVALPRGGGAETEASDFQHIGNGGPGRPTVRRTHERFLRVGLSGALLASGKKQIACLARDRHQFIIVPIKRRDIAAKDFCPACATIGGFENALTGIDQIERIGEHPIGGDGALIQIIRAFETAPAGYTRKSDRIPGLAAVEGIIGLNAIAWRQDYVFRRAGGNRPSVSIARECGTAGKTRPGLAAIGRVNCPSIANEPRDKARIRRGIIDRPACIDIDTIYRAIAGGIGIEIADIKERAIPGGDHRIAARRHDDFVGDQLFDAEALVIPGNRRIPL